MTAPNPYEGFPIAEALRLLRTRKGLTQTPASKRARAPDFRSISHWETRRKVQSLPLLARYLESLGFDFHSLQDALDQAAGRPSVRGDLEGLRGSLEGRLLDVERRLSELERQDADT